jgi:hypothetical protein
MAFSLSCKLKLDQRIDEDGIDELGANVLIDIVQGQNIPTAVKEILLHMSTLQVSVVIRRLTSLLQALYP